MNNHLFYDVEGLIASFSLKGRRGLLVARGVLLFGNSTSGAHNIREYARAYRSRLVFSERFPCGGRTGLAARPRAKTRTGGILFGFAFCREGRP